MDKNTVGYQYREILAECAKLLAKKKFTFEDLSYAENIIRKVLKEEYYIQYHLLFTHW